MKANAEPRRKGNLGCDEAAVSDVIGTILLVGITVMMMVGLSAVMLNLEGPRDRIHVDIRMSVLAGAGGWGTGDEFVRIEHVGGETMPQSSARVRVTVGDTSVDVAGLDLDQGFADGVFGLGDTWQRTQTINNGQGVEVLLIDDDGNAVTTSTRLSAKDGGGGTGTSGEVRYVASGSASVGILSGFSAMRSASDSGAVATLREASSGGTPSTVTRSPISVSESSSVTSPGNVLTSNDDRATMDSNGAHVDATGFSLGATDVVIDSVTIGMEARRGASVPGTPTDSSIDLSYKINGILGATMGTHIVAANPNDAHYTTTVTGDRMWTVADIAGLTVVAERVSGTRATEIDHLYVAVTYTTGADTDAEATFGFTSVSAGNNELQIRYQTLDETFTVQVRDDASDWNDRGTLDSSGTPGFTDFTYTLQSGEYLGGAPQVRLVDGEGTLRGEVKIDYMRIDTT